MTLGIGNHVLKVDPETKQPPANEVHIEFEVEGYGTSFVFNADTGAPSGVVETLGKDGFFTGFVRHGTDPAIPPARDPFVPGEQYVLVLLRKVR